MIFLIRPISATSDLYEKFASDYADDEELDIKTRNIPIFMIVKMKQILLNILNKKLGNGRKRLISLLIRTDQMNH